MVGCGRDAAGRARGESQEPDHRQPDTCSDANADRDAPARR